MVTVLLADDHAVVRRGIRELLSMDPRIQLVGEAWDLPDATEKAHNLRPDVLILDLHMRERTALTSDVKDQLSSCGAKVLAISFADDQEASDTAKSLGAAALLDKMNLVKELIPMIMKLDAQR